MAFDNHHKMMVASSHTHIAAVFSHQFSHFKHKHVHSSEIEICTREYTILKNFNQKKRTDRFIVIDDDDNNNDGGWYKNRKSFREKREPSNLYTECKHTRARRKESISLFAVQAVNATLQCSTFDLLMVGTNTQNHDASFQ